jgi:ribonuclease P protein component
MAGPKRAETVGGPPLKAQTPGRQNAGGTHAGGFSRAARLVKHADFERVYEEGQRHFARHMTVFFLRRQSGSARIGLTVGRVLGGAVQRNRIKRRLREAVRLQLCRLGAAADVVINPKKSVLQADFGELNRELGRALEVISGKLRNSSGSRAAGRGPE